MTPCDARIKRLADEASGRVYRRIDHMFAGLLAVQWLAGIALALWFTPQAWSGAERSIHPHLWAAVFLGGAVVSCPLLFIAFRPGQAKTRHFVAAAQMLSSALLIHLTGGRIESHFHIFGSLAFLSFYGDWRALLTGTAVVTAEHFLRGLIWPESIYGTSVGAQWRWLEHACWVVFLDIFLFYSIWQGRKMLWEAADREVRLQEANEGIERTVELRTRELRQVQEQLHSAFDDAAIGMALFAPNGTGLQVNRALCRIVGYSPEEMRSFTFDQITHPDDRVEDEALAKQLLEGTIAAYEIEKRYIHKLGHLVWILLNVTLTRDLGGNPLYFISQIQDISQRRQAEDERDRFFTQTLNLNGICGFDGRFKRLNRAWETVLGFATDELVTQPFLDSIHADDRDDVMDQVRTLQTGVDVQSFECRSLCRDGSWRWVLWNATPCVEQQVFYIIGHDITERKRGVEALAAVSQTQQAILDYSAYSIVTTSADGLIQTFNRASERMFGYSSAEVVGRLTPAVLHLSEEVSARAEELSRELGEVVHGMDVFSAMARRGLANEDEWTLVRKDASRFPALVNVTALMNEEGRLTGLVGIASDITARKESEERLRHTLRRLEEAREQAEGANRAKSEFLANMSHEIRTPMNGVMGLTELLLDTKLDFEQRQSLEMVKSSAEALMTVINDILDFSKIEAGRLELDLIEFSLHELLGTTLKLLGGRAHAKGLELALEIPISVPDRIVGDPGRLRQVVINLVGNAIKFTETGEIIVRVAVNSHQSSGYRLQFSVTDTGIGIPADKQSLIFQAFSQADGSTTRRFGGTGLGLTISDRLVSLMGGTLAVESEVGRGSRFHFEARFGETNGPPAATTLATVATLDGVSVLVVDDNATNRRILEQILRDVGGRPICVCSASQALTELGDAAALGVHYPLMLLDAMMPEMDGFQLVERLRLEPALAPNAIMMLTSGDLNGDPARCRHLGISSYLVKPIKKGELLDAIVATLHPAAAASASSLRKFSADPGMTDTMSSGEGGGLRLLLAEDNPVNQRVATRMLEKLGHTVAVANNGQEALMALRVGEFDIVLMDMQMPVMDGWEATRVIRAAETDCALGRHQYIVALTAHAMNGDRELCLAAGMDDYLSKPITIDELLRVLRPQIESKAGTRLVRPPAVPAKSATRVPLGTPFDRDSAMRRLDGDEALLYEIAGIFVEQTPKRMQEAQEAVAAGDLTRLRNVAHALKGSLGYLNAGSALSAATELEKSAGSADLEKSTGILCRLQHDVDDLLGSIGEMLRSV